MEETYVVLKEALKELQDVMDYVASESGDCNILNWLGPVEEKLVTVLSRCNINVKSK